MAFTVEDGTGLAGANAYISVAEYDTHHTDRDTDLTGQSTAQKQGSIVIATDFVDKRYGPRFRGFKRTSSQALEWPRHSAFDNDDLAYDPVPRALKRAVAELAIIHRRIGTLLPVPARPFATVDDTGTVVALPGGQLANVREKIGPMEESTRFFKHDPGHDGPSSSVVPGAFLPSYPEAEEWLRELLVSGGSVELVRA